MKKPYANTPLYSARPLGAVAGRPVWRFTVRVTFGEEASLRQINHYPSGTVQVISHTAQGACDLLTDELGHIPCVELECFGPRGGVAAHRYWGWERAIFAEMRQRGDARRQLTIF